MFLFQSFDNIRIFNQPCLAIVGNSPILVLCIADKKFYFEDIGVGLKAFFSYQFGLNIEYLKECKIIWNFIQKYIFKIFITSCDGPSNETLAKDLGLIE